MRLNKLRPVLGILIIISAAALLYFWETMGREEVMTTKAFAAACDIQEGAALTEDMLELRAYMNENVPEGAILESELDSAVGRIAGGNIVKGMQLNRSMLNLPEERSEGLSSFVIEGEWIAHRSASLRAGDRIALLSSDTSLNLGEFTLVYVRDEDERLVLEDDGAVCKDIFKRGDGTGHIATLEIATTAEEYGKILEYIKCGENGLNRLIIVQLN